VTIAVLRYLEALRGRIRPVPGEEGQGLAEYALILALIAVVAVVAVTFLGSNLSSTLSMIGNSVASR
jgi:pilus assembly protein Flp/PilA